MQSMNPLFFRMCYLILAWAAALKPVLLTETPDAVVIFSTLFLFWIPLVIDYFGFNRFTKQGKFLQHLGGFLTVFATLFALVGLLGGVPLDETDGTILMLSLDTIWKLSGIWIILAVVDWIVSITPKEVSGQLAVRKMIRDSEEQAFKETMKKRTTHYNKKERSVDL